MFRRAVLSAQRPAVLLEGNRMQRGRVRSSSSSVSDPTVGQLLGAESADLRAESASIQQMVILSLLLIWYQIGCSGNFFGFCFFPSCIFPKGKWIPHHY